MHHKIMLVVLLFLSHGARATEYTPAAYYRFENASDLGQDSSPNALPLTIPQTWPPAGSATAAAPKQTTAGGIVGAFLAFAGETDATRPKAWGASSAVNRSGAPGLTVEFLLAPTPGCFLRGGAAVLLRDEHGTIEFELTFTGLTFRAATVPAGAAGVVDTLAAAFEGAGVLAADFWAGGAKRVWHHVALVKDAATGAQAVWVDGENPAALRLPGNNGNGTAVPGRAMAGGGGALTLDASDAVALCAGLDEVAVWREALPASLIYQHAQNTLVHRQPYNITNPGGAPPAPAPRPGPANASYYDAKAYAPGTELPSPPGRKNNTRGAQMSCLDQLLFAPSPRYNASRLAATPQNFNWMAPGYMAGEGQPLVPRGLLPNLTVAVQAALSERWHYGIVLSQFWEAGKAADLAAVEMANAHPERALHVIIARAQMRGAGGRSQLYNQSLPAGCYATNAAGQFIGVEGTVVPAGGKKTLRPMGAAMATAKGCPDALFDADGARFRDGLFARLAANLTRPVDVVNADGEVFISLMSPAETFDFAADPAVAADFAASGAANWETYWSLWRTRLTNGFSNAFMQAPALKDTVFKGAFFTQYQVQGTNPFFGNWSVVRDILTPMPDPPGQAATTSHFSTMDIYLQHPREWWGGGGPDHGIEWAVRGRLSEIANGDAPFSPFFAAGWSGKAEENLRPAQALGLLKLLSAWGASWFYTGFFSLGAPFPPSENWCWQAMMPAFAQAAASQAPAFLDAGHVLAATPNTTAALPWGGPAGRSDGTDGAPLLWAGAPHVLAIARRLDAAPAYLVTVAVMRLSNDAANLAWGGAARTATTVARVAVPGVPGPPLTLEAREQGSTYVYHNISAAGPVLYQLDAWHEASHPLYWAAGEGGGARERVEAELFEGHLSRAGARALATEVPPGRKGTGDFSAFTTYVDLARAPRAGVRYSARGGGGRAVVGLRVRVRRGAATAALAFGGEGGEGPGCVWSATVRAPSSPAGGDDDGWTWWEEQDFPCQGSRWGRLTLSGTGQVDAIDFVFG